MTRDRAQKEAWERWGHLGPPRIYTFAIRHRVASRGRKYEVSARLDDGTWKCIAFGASDESWEDAFIDADKRAAAVATSGKADR